MNKKIILILILSSVLLVSGCETKQQEYNIEYKVDSVYVSMNDNVMLYSVSYIDNSGIYHLITDKGYINGLGWNYITVRDSDRLYLVLERGDSNSKQWTLYKPKNYKVEGTSSEWTEHHGKTTSEETSQTTRVQ